MIPIYEPYLRGNEKKYVLQCLDTNWISSKGEFIEKFENSVKTYVNRQYASSCFNGTVALDLAFKALQIQDGDEIITTSFTYVASSNAILNNNAKPIFIDIEPGSWNIDTTKIENKITKNTKAILLSNLYGFLPDYNRIEEICSKYNLFLIEDAAESLGAQFETKKSGSFGVISTLSFFGNKTITTGEGGMVLTDDKVIYERVEKLKNQGNSVNRKYHHDILGFNYRMTNIQAAIGLAQMELIDQILEKKKNIANRYRKALNDLVVFQQNLSQESHESNWIITILFDNIKLRSKCEKFLEALNVETRPLFTPVDTFEFYDKEVSELSITNSLYPRGLCLPSYPALSNYDQDIVINAIKKCIENE